MRISAFTQIIVTVAVTAWVFILPVKAVATILVFELALLLSIKRDRMTMAAIGGGRWKIFSDADTVGACQ